MFDWLSFRGADKFPAGQSKPVARGACVAVNLSGPFWTVLASGHGLSRKRPLERHAPWRPGRGVSRFWDFRGRFWSRCNGISEVEAMTSEAAPTTHYSTIALVGIGVSARAKNASVRAGHPHGSGATIVIPPAPTTTTAALDPPRWYIISPPFTLRSITG